MMTPTSLLDEFALALRDECVRATGSNDYPPSRNPAKGFGPCVHQVLTLGHLRTVDLVASLYDPNPLPLPTMLDLWDQVAKLMAERKHTEARDWLQQAHPHMPYSKEVDVGIAGVLAQYIVLMSWRHGTLEVSGNTALLSAGGHTVGIRRGTLVTTRGTRRLLRPSNLETALYCTLGDPKPMGLEVGGLRRHLSGVLPRLAGVINTVFYAAVQQQREPALLDLFVCRSEVKGRKAREERQRLEAAMSFLRVQQQVKHI